MRGPRRLCWIIRVRPPLVARRMAEPLVAARSTRPVHPNLRLATCTAPLEARFCNPSPPATTSRAYRRDRNRAPPRRSVSPADRQTKIGQAILPVPSWSTCRGLQKPAFPKSNWSILCGG